MSALAAPSHTGCLAGATTAWDAFFRQTRAIQVAGMEELIDTSVGFSCPPEDRIYLKPSALAREKRITLNYAGYWPYSRRSNQYTSGHPPFAATQQEEPRDKHVGIILFFRCPRIEVVSKPSIGFKIKAERGDQPQDYITYLRIGRHAPTPDLGPRGGF
jgi:hypothetical protein